MVRVLAIIAATRRSADETVNGSAKEGKGEEQEQEMPDGFLEVRPLASNQSIAECWR